MFARLADVLGDNMTGKIAIWFDFASPYAFVATKRIRAMPHEKAVLFDWNPFLVGVALRAKTNGLSATQLTTDAEKRYRKNDVARSCEELDIQLRWPSDHPRGSLLAARIAFWAKNFDWQVKFIEAVFDANFVFDQDVGSEGCIASILENIGVVAEPVLQAANDASHKEAFRHHVDTALEIGIFGVPTFVVGGELFWGNDRLDQALKRASA